MGKHNGKQVAPFSLEGRFLQFGIEDGFKLKRLYLATSTGEYTVKLTRAARSSLVAQGIVLTAGDWIQVTGEQTFDPATQETKFKAEFITPATPKSVAAPTKPIAKPTTILVCQKSDCMNRGGKGVCRALEAELRDRGLQDQVKIKGTGCMKQCKAGPNMVMPDKTRYSRISGKDIPAIVEHHYPQPAPTPPTRTTPDVVPALVAPGLS